MVSQEEAEELGVIGEAEVIVAKNRQGRCGIAKLMFEGEYVRFVESEPEVPQDYTEFRSFAENGYVPEEDEF